MAILEVKGLVKYYGRRKVVDGVSFEVDRGEVVGLLGPNGAGKTTSFRMATGQVTPNEGVVWFAGNEVTALPMYRRARLGMGYLAQEPSIFRKLTVEQNILAVLEAMPYHRTLGRSPTRKERWEMTENMLTRFSLHKVRKSISARLSGGEKRRLEIARCLVCDPLLILLDEPFTGIDPPTIADIQQIVRELKEAGIGILVTDHRAREILMVTDRIYVIKDGVVRTQGTPLEIIEDPVAISEYLGTSFTDGSFGGIPVPQHQQSRPSSHVVSEVLEQEKVHRLIEQLKSPETAIAAAQDLRERGSSVVPALLEALERRDVELRRQAFMIVQGILGEQLNFDPYAPEVLRRQQLLLLREQLQRRAA